jgi:8-oxo-dGTP pyrophosphatase MutT (NUDIX family)
MKRSAGILFLYRNKALLCHPTKAKWIGTFGPPKGGIEKGETPLQAAIRECREEASIKISEDKIDPNNFKTIDYKTKNGKTFKKVILFIVKINSLNEIGLDNEVIPTEKLQHEEVDWCGFLDKDELGDKVFWRFKDLLIDELTN